MRRRRTPVSVFASKDLLSLCVCVGVWLPSPPPCAAASLPPCLPLILHLASSAFPASSSNSSSRNCSFFSRTPAAKRGGPQFPVPTWGRAGTRAPQHISLSHSPPPAFLLLAQHPAPCTLHQGQAHNVSVIQPPAKSPCSGWVTLAPLPSSPRSKPSSALAP